MRAYLRANDKNIVHKLQQHIWQIVENAGNEKAAKIILHI